MGTKPAFGLRAQCSGFLYGLSVAKSMIASGQYQRILLVGAELHSKALEMSERGRGVSVLFGDGAGAVVLEGTEHPETGIIDCVLHAEGAGADTLGVSAPRFDVKR